MRNNVKLICSTKRRCYGPFEEKSASRNRLTFHYGRQCDWNAFILSYANGICMVICIYRWLEEIETSGFSDAETESVAYEFSRQCLHRTAVARESVHGGFLGYVEGWTL